VAEGNRRELQKHRGDPLSTKSKLRAKKRATAKTSSQSGLDERSQETRRTAQEPDARSGKPVRAAPTSSDSAKLEKPAALGRNLDSPVSRVQQHVVGPLSASAARGLGTGTRTRTPRPQSTAARPEVTDLTAEAQPLGPRTQVGTAGAAGVVQSQPAAGQLQPLGTGKRIRTTPPQPVLGEIEEIATGWSKQDHPQNQSAGLQSGLLERGLFQGAVQDPALLQSLGANPAVQKLEEKAEHFRHIQDFVQNPALLDLRAKERGTSSTPEEIELRKGEVRYQIEVMKSLLSVLTDELNELEQARPQVSGQPGPSTHS